MRRALLVTLALLLGTLALPSGWGHLGQGGGLDPSGRLEAERYSTPDAGCDPDFDAEHTQPHPYPAASNGFTLFMPHSGCGVTFQGVTFPDAGTFTGFRAQTGGATQTFTLRVRVLVDGALAAEGTLTAHPFDGLTSAGLSAVSLVPPGTHAVRLEYQVLSGPGYGNIHLDYVEGDFDGSAFEPPSKPLGLTAKPGTSAGSVRLQWAPPASSGDFPLGGYWVLRGDQAGEEAFLAQSSATTFTDAGAGITRVRHYRVVAFSLAGPGEPSDGACSAANPWRPGEAPPGSPPCPPLPGWSEQVLLERTEPLPAAGAGPVDEDLLEVQGAPTATGYALQVRLLGEALPALEVFTNGLQGPAVGASLLQLPAVGVGAHSVRVSASWRSDPAQVPVCLVQVGPDCVAMAPLHPGTLLASGPAALLVVRATVRDDGGQVVLDQALTVPFAGEALALALAPL